MAPVTGTLSPSEAALNTLLREHPKFYAEVEPGVLGRAEGDFTAFIEVIDPLKINARVFNVRTLVYVDDEEGQPAPEFTDADAAHAWVNATLQYCFATAAR